MFNKLKSYFKSKDYKIIESYFADGFDIKIKEDQDGKQIVSLRTSTPNRLIEITKNETNLKHVIYDQSKGVTQEIDIPINIYKKVFDGGCMIEKKA